MKRLPLGSLRLRLMVLVVLAVIPAIILLVWSDTRSRQKAVYQARAQVLRAAQQASRSEVRAIGQAHQVLLTLSHFPSVMRHGSEACTQIFGQLIETTQGYSAFLAADTSGMTFATFPPKENPISLADRPYFKDVMKTGQFVVGNYLRGRITGEPVLSLAYPVKDPAGKIIAVLVTGLRTEWLNQLLTESELPENAQLTVIDINGRVLAHNPPEPGLLGKAMFDQNVMKRFTDLHQGIYEGNNLDGEKRLFGFARLGKASGAIFVLFSVPEKDIFAEPDQVLLEDLIAVLGAVALALLVAWFMGTASVVRPVQELLAVTQRMASGDLEVRVGDKFRSGELGKLAKGFDTMAAALLQRQKEQETAQKALHESEVRFQTVADFTYDWEWWQDMEGHFVYMSPSCKRITGHDAAEFMEDPDLLLRMIHPEDKDKVTERLLDEDYYDQLLEMDFRVITKGGKTIWLEHKSQPVYGSDGERLGRRASNRDGTERRRTLDELARQNKLQTGQAELTDLMRGNLDVKELSSRVLAYLCEHLGYQVGLIYLSEDDYNLRLAAGYAYQSGPSSNTVIAPGQGLVGQAAQEKRDLIVHELPDNYMRVSSGLGNSAPRSLHLKPLIHEGRVMAVLELGSLGDIDHYQTLFLDSVAESIAIALHSAEARNKLAKALEEAQAMSEELQSQQEELRTTNEELEEQARLLKDSEEKLRAQQEELQVTNEELEEKNELLVRQKKEVEWARKDLQEKAEALALASKYKSEFLANMSHELRTPLNSLLLLAQSLADNKEGNLSDEQVEFAQIIHGSGSDLLNLINEILDLAKIEAGRIDLRPGKVSTEDLAHSVRTAFTHMAKDKGLTFEVEVDPGAPRELISDQKRIEQILKNLLSNAIKFTDKGRVDVSFHRPAPEQIPPQMNPSGGKFLAVSVKDTGIGIEAKQQKVIFEAFQQADGSTSRRYGGTGLGLSISRELARLLGGVIEMQSRLGEGATFTVFLPLSMPQDSGPSKAAAPAEQPPQAAPSAAPAAEEPPPLWREPGKEDDQPEDESSYLIDDDRENLDPEERIILVIEDDANFAKILYGKCHEKGFKCLVAPTGETGLQLAREYMPVAVILDLHLPGLDGWGVLDALKGDTRTRHIPVHIMSVEPATAKALRMGAVGHATKPMDASQLEAAFARLEEVASQGTKRVLVVDDDDRLRANTVSLIQEGDVEVDEARTGAEAMKALREKKYDCIVLDLGLPDMDGRQMLERLQHDKAEIPPVIVHTGRDMTQEEEAALRESTDSIIIKDVRSQERLLDEISLFLHRVVSKMPARKQEIIRSLHEGDDMLAGKKVLVVDDDMRTTFAVSALLSEMGMIAFKANNGEKALAVLEEKPDVDLVLMDIMMPVMDGYQAMREIRAKGKFKDLPIIALTAKAMPADREKCLAAGANDYLPKPVDKDKLISMIRVWLYR